MVETLTGHVVLVGNTNRAEGIVSHRFDKVYDHLLLVLLCELSQFTVVANNPRTPEHV